MASALAPVPLLLASKAWTFTPAGFLDPFICLGYFNWPGRLNGLGTNYKVSRVPGLVPGGCQRGL